MLAKGHTQLHKEDRTSYVYGFLGTEASWATRKQTRLPASSKRLPTVRPPAQTYHHTSETLKKREMLQDC